MRWEDDLRRRVPCPLVLLDAADLLEEQFGGRVSK